MECQSIAVATILLSQRLHFHDTWAVWKLCLRFCVVVAAQNYSIPFNTRLVLFSCLLSSPFVAQFRTGVFLPFGNPRRREQRKATRKGIFNKLLDGNSQDGHNISLQILSPKGSCPRGHSKDRHIAAVTDAGPTTLPLPRAPIRHRRLLDQKPPAPARSHTFDADLQGPVQVARKAGPEVFDILPQEDGRGGGTRLEQIWGFFKHSS